MIFKKLVVLIIVFFQITFIVFSQSIKIYFPHNGINNIMISDKENILVSANIPFSNKINIQAGFSPFRNISIIGGYFKWNSIKDDWRMFQPQFDEFLVNRKSIIGAIGAYYLIDISKEKKYRVKSKRRENTNFKNSIWEKKGILITSHLGFSTNFIENKYKKQNIIESHSQLNSNSLFFQVGTFLKYKSGQFGISHRFSLYKFNKGNINGDIFNIDSIEKLQKNISSKPFFRIYSMNYNYQVGIRPAKFIFGISVDYTNLYRDEFVNLEQIYFYTGASFDLNGLMKILLRKN